MGKTKRAKQTRRAASELLMDESAAAAALLLSVRTLQRWRVEGRGPRFVSGASVSSTRGQRLRHA